MPRGSLPGERRGGRQRGTPNKTTALRDAAIFNAVADPDFLPLDLFLVQMRDANLPADERVTAAEAALPFVHAKPKDPPDRSAQRKYGTPVGSVNVIKESDTGSAAPVEASAVAAAGADIRDLLPLDFLLGLMRDPQTPHRLRMRVAHIAAPYLHAKPGRRKNEIVIDDPYGFICDPAVAAALRDAKLRSAVLREAAYPRLTPDNPEQKKIEARIAEIEKGLKCPAGYTGLEAREDWKRLKELSRKRKSERPYNKLSKEEDAEEANVTARLAAYQQSDEGRARSRISSLKLPFFVRRADQPPTPAQQHEREIRNSEIERLKKLYPDLPPDPDEDNDPIAQSHKRALEAIRKARKENEERVALARAEGDLRRNRSPRGS